MTYYTLMIYSLPQSASCLAHLAAALLGDAARHERRDAGAKVLFGLASLAGRGQQRSPSALAAAAEEALVAADVARDGATETLRHAIALASPPGARVTEASPALRTAASATSARYLSVSGTRGSDGGGSGGGGRDGDGKIAGDPGRGRGGGVGSGDCKAVQDWVLQTLAPLLQHPLGRETSRAKTAGVKRSGTIPIVLPGTQRKLSAAELKKPVAEVRAIELSAVLGVADALLLQATRGAPPQPVDEPGRRGVKGAPQPLLASLLLETPLAAGLLRLACSGCAPVSAEDNAAQSSSGTAASGRIPPSRRRQRQRNTNGGDGDATEGTALWAVHMTADERAVAAATAEAALVIAREAAALCPEGLWVGLRAELLPALAAGPESPSGGVGGSVACVDGGDGEGGGGGSIGVARGVRAGLVLKEVVAGMGIGVVPFAARLLPVALRGMTDANEQVCM